MKPIIVVCSIVIILFAATSHVKAAVIAGPITNPANGHDYYLLSPNTWTMSEAEAESIGGTLAVITNTDEQNWVFSTFGDYGGINRNLWIGLHRNKVGKFVWVTGAKVGYTNWAPGQPDNAGSKEDFVHIFSNINGRFPGGTWNDFQDRSSVAHAPCCGVVEIGGMPEEKTLTEKEKSLIGTWYEGGKWERPCWIAGTENMLFIIPNNRLATQARIGDDGFIVQRPMPTAMKIYSGISGYDSVPGVNSQMSMNGEIIKNKILWSNGTWWSRNPIEYKTEEKTFETNNYMLDSDSTAK